MEQLLKTKFFIPTIRPDLVLRPRLFEQLDKGIQCKLILVSAPAGYGKTTLISEWVEQLPLDDKKQFRISWLSLDDGDNDVARFLTHFISALNFGQGIENEIGADALGMLQSPQPPPVEVVLTTLINEIAAITAKTIFVLDDYHLIEDQPVNEALSFFIEHMPPQMHLVIVTRDDPQLSLARLRALNHLTELRAADLRFTSSEAAEFLNRVMELSLPVEDVHALERRTEGWIVGLQLAALSLQGQQDQTGLVKLFTGSNRYVLDYLIEEVLEQQPKAVQSFLLQTSILSKLSGSLCDALTRQDGGQETLEMLERANLFLIPLDNERCWYRYHHLFADLLQNRLRVEYAEDLPDLYCRAADWYERQGNLIEAVDLFLKAQEYQRAVDIILLGINTIIKQERYTQSFNHKTILRWIETLPDEFIRNNPRLDIIFAQSSWELGRRGRTTLEAHFRSAQRNYDRLVAANKIKPGDSEFLRIPFDINVGRSRSTVYTGDFNLAVELAEKAFALNLSEDIPALVDGYVVLHWAYREAGYPDKALEACEQIISISKPAGYHYGIIEGSLGVGFSYQMQGELDRAAQTYPHVIRYAEQHNLVWMRPFPVIYIKWSNLCYYRNDLAQAEEYLLKAIDLCQQSGYTLNLYYARIYLAQLRLVQGQVEAALDTIQEVEQVVRQNRNNAYDIEIEAYKAWIQARVGNQDAAAAWLNSIDLRIGERIGYWRGIQCIQAAHVMLDLDQIDRVLDFLPRLERAAKNGGSLPNQIEALVMQAVVCQKKGDTGQALKFLEKALVLSAPEKFKQVFLNEGPLMAGLLDKLRIRKIEPAFLQELLAAFLIVEQGQFRPKETDSPESILIEPLSSREIEVLQLIAEGMTNPEIAARLYLSLNTVKVHSRNIYGKLGVNNRTQAVIRGKDLGILTSN